jgi:hypothetical protein
MRLRFSTNFVAVDGTPTLLGRSRVHAPGKNVSKEKPTMSTTSYKAYAIERELSDKLKKFVAATLPVATESADADGNPVLTLSADATPATGEKVVVIRVMPIQRPTAKDSLGNPGITPSGHVIQVCTEANYEGATDSVLDILGPKELCPILIEVGRVGCNVEWYQSANGTVPSTTQMTAGNLKGNWRDLYWNPLKAV